MTHLFVYITAGSLKEAEMISQVLISERLAACTNIIPEMNALFHWKGEVTQEQEVVIIAKTTSKKYPGLESKVKSVHSYDCPCIIALPIAMGNAPYLEWIKEEVHKKKEEG